MCLELIESLVLTPDIRQYCIFFLNQRKSFSFLVAKMPELQEKKNPEKLTSHLFFNNIAFLWLLIADMFDKHTLY